MTLLSTVTKKRSFSTRFKGSKVYVSALLNKPFSIVAFEITASKYNKGKKLAGIQVVWAGVSYLLLTESFTLIDTLAAANKSELPFYTKIVRKSDGYYYFVKLNAFEMKQVKSPQTPF